MKCLYQKACEVKGADGSCNASIKGYCEFQEKPAEVIPEPVKVKCVDCEPTGSQDAWIEQTIAEERAGHVNKV